MVQIHKNGLTPNEIAAIENSQAEVMRNSANIDYIAMMADIEIPTEEDENNERAFSEI